MVEEKVDEKAEGIDELLEKPIAEIDAMAKERGLNPSDYQNMDELATAIHEKPMAEEKAEGKEPEGGTPEGEKTEGEKPEKLEEINELLKKPREELDTIATEKGLDPDDYHNKEEIAKAILESE